MEDIFNANVVIIVLLLIIVIILVGALIHYSIQQRERKEKKGWWMYKQLIGGCSGTRYGCCPDGRTARSDAQGSNC